MTKAQSVYQYEAPRCPDGWNEAERRFYARVIEIFDDIYIKYGKVDKTTVKAIEKTLGGSSVEDFEGNSLSAGVANIVKLVCDKAVIDVLSAGQIAAYSFEATFGHLVTLSAKLASFDFETVKNLVSQALIVEQAVGTNVRIKNLVVDYAQMSVATIENLCIKAADGKYYVLSVDPDGKVSATETTVEEVEIAAGVTNKGNVILETDILATNLTTSNLYASVLLANEITAYRIDVDTLTAREAFIQSLTAQQAFIKWIQTEEIIGGKSLTQIAGEATDAKNRIDFATAYDSQEPPETAPAAGKLWIDRGTTPPIFRRWKGENVSTEREWSEAFAPPTAENPNAYYDNSSGLLESIDSVLTSFTPGQTGSGDPSPDNYRPLAGFDYIQCLQNSYGQTTETFVKGEIRFGKIVYGADIDWIGGVWKQTYWEYVLTGTESVNLITVQGYPRFDVAIPAELGAQAASFTPVCTHLLGSEVPYGLNNLDNAVCVDKSLVNSPLYIRCDRFATPDELKAWLAAQYAAGTPVRVVFPLLAPVAHSFAPANIGVFSSYLYINVSGYVNGSYNGAVPKTLDVEGSFSGWQTLNSTEDIRAAQGQIQLQQANAQAAIDELRTAVVTDNEGVHVRKVDNENNQLTQNELLITQKDLNMVVNGKRSSTYGDGYIRLLDMVIRVAAGGIVIEAAEG